MGSASQDSPADLRCGRFPARLGTGGTDDRRAVAPSRAALSECGDISPFSPAVAQSSTAYRPTGSRAVAILFNGLRKRRNITALRGHSPRSGEAECDGATACPLCRPVPATSRGQTAIVAFSPDIHLGGRVFSWQGNCRQPPDIPHSCPISASASLGRTIPSQTVSYSTTRPEAASRHRSTGTAWRERR